MPRPPQKSRTPVLNVAVVVGLLAGVSLLPPYTALREAQRSETLRVCVPRALPPLVTETGGLVIEILTALADRLGVRLVTNPSSTLSQDLNPRNWRISRAQCDLIAGGVLATEMTRAFLDTSLPFLRTSWVRLGECDLDGATIGVFPGSSGFDRIALGQFLRGAGAEVRIFNSATRWPRPSRGATSTSV